MSLPAGEDPDSSQVSSSRDHHQISNIKLDRVRDLACGNVDAYCVVDFDLRVRIANGPAIVCNTVGDAFLTKTATFHFCKLVLCVCVFYKVSDAISNTCNLHSQ